MYNKIYVITVYNLNFDRYPRTTTTIKLLNNFITSKSFLMVFCSPAPSSTPTPGNHSSDFFHYMLALIF